MNFGTKLRTILAIATCLNTALMSVDLTGFANVYVDFIYKIISIVLNFVIVALVTWFNNDYTEAACMATGMLRQYKEIQAADYTGETYERGDEDE